MIGQEVELKYNAANISPEKFKEFCLSKKPHRILEIAGYDTFFNHPTDPNSFFRYRETDMEAELTFKRKTQSNNVIRTEHNLSLSYALVDKGAAFCKDMGYEFNTTIFKIAYVYEYEAHILCYYVVYNLDLVELGRFIEIELNEHIEWESETSARNALDALEKGCYSLGLTLLNRVSASLFEMFRRK